MSFYTEWGKLSLLGGTSHRALYVGLIITIILGVAGYAAIILLREVAPDRLNSSFIRYSSISIVALAIILNLLLAACRLLTDDPPLQELIARETNQVIADARAATNVDGVQL